MTIDHQTKSAALKGLYAITDPQLLPGEKLITGVQEALEGGARIIQYRDKIASDIEMLRSAQSLKALCEEHNALFIVNDNLDLCARVNADGVHLGKQDGDARQARICLGPEKIVGVTCHSDLDYARYCHQQGADYCAFGRLFPSHTKPNAPPCDLGLLAKLDEEAFSTVAIGGITIDNAPQVLSYSIDMLAVIQGVFGQADIRQAAHSFANLFDESI